MEKLSAAVSRLCSKKKLILLLLTFLAGLFLYSLLITARLTNTYDGLWEPGYYKAGRWEISCGRFVWPLLSLLRAFLAQDPYMSVISLLVISFALLVFDETLGIEKLWQALLANLMFMANVIICVFLSFRFMSPTFAFSFLFSILAVYLLFTLKRYWNVLAAGVCIMLCMGLYQACIGCTAVLLLSCLMLSAIRGKTIKELLQRLLDGILSVIAGGILYVVLLRLVLKLSGLSMSSYGGGSSYSLWGTIVHLPSSLVRVYREFFSYCFRDRFHIMVYSSRLHTFAIFCILAMAGALLCLLFWFLKNRRTGLILLIALLLMPAASNAILFVATEVENKIQMSAPLALVFPCLLVLFFLTAGQLTAGSLRRVAAISAVGFACLFTHLEALQVCLDQNVMLETTAAAKWMYESTLEDLRTEELLDSETEYFYYGRATDNSLFRKGRDYDKANAYAQIGNFVTNRIGVHMNWRGISYLTGTNMLFISSATFDRLSSDESLMREIRSMPAFPENGYIRKCGKYVVVKISDETAQNSGLR